MNGRYPKLVETAWDICEQLVADWQQNPYRWDSEADIQAALYSRLSTVCRLIGFGEVLGNYPDAVPGFEGRQVWSRVACEPAISYQYSDGKSYVCKPDLVLWDEIDDPDSPPDAEDQNWPVLWACELKYNGVDPTGWDLEKLNYLADQGVVRYGCWITFARTRARSGSGIDWRRDSAGGRIWVCDAFLPALRRPRSGRAPAWSQEEFEVLLRNNNLPKTGFAELLPQRSPDAIEVVRQGIHSYHRGMNISMLSRMMLRTLDERDEQVECPVCKEGF